MAPTSEDNPAVKAARDILNAQNRPQRSTKEKPLSVRAAAAKYKTSKTAVARHLKSMKLLGKADYSDKGPGRPKNLDGSEERAVVAYINWLERAGIPSSREFVEEAANKLRASRTPPAPPVGGSWYTRFLADHPELLERRRNIRASGRESPGFEHMNIQRLEEFYTNLARLVKNCDLTASQIFNADECGLRFGPVRERLEMAIVKKKRTKRESSTIVVCANAAGTMVPPMMVFKTWPTHLWDISGLDGNLRFARSKTGCSDEGVTLDWIRHFNMHSFELTSKAQSRGVTFTEWFGCDEFMRDPDDPTHIWHDPRFKRPEEERIWRLLVLDDFPGEMSVDFMDYCIRFDILLYLLPSHTISSLMQPLDVGVLQPLNTPEPSLRNSTCDSHHYRGTSEFFSRFREIISTGFTAQHIINGFEKSGVFPVNGSGVIQALKEKTSVPETAAPTLPLVQSQEDRFRQGLEIARDIRHKYFDVFDSPTREAHGVIEDVLNEAILLTGLANKMSNE